MIARIFYSIVIALILFVVGGLFLPRYIHVERSIEIERPASTVFTILNSFDNFSVWSPWAERDPEARYEFSGPPSGIGARMSWEGDPRLVGKGWQEITASEPYSRLEVHLDFEQQGAANAYFQIDSMGDGSTVTVTWGFDTDLLEGQGLFGGLLSRYFGLFFDRWVGTDYETGLSRLKLFTESLPATDFTDLDAEIIEAQPFEVLYVSGNTSKEFDDIAASLAAAYQEITQFITENDIEMTAQPMAITRAWDERGYRFDAAIPVAMKDVELTGKVRAGTSPQGPAVKVVHRGPYDRMAPSYEKLAAYMAVHGLKEGRVSWEHYISDPGETPEEELVTHIYFLIDTGP